MLRGRRGIGKQQFATAFAQWLLCESASPAGGCGSCASCNWFAQGAHPDFRLLEPEGVGERPEGEGTAEGRPERKPRRQITVDQVRALADFVNLSSHRSGFKVVLIAPADALNIHAANALLKTLEEPPPATVFLLVSHRSQRLLPTIVSRCEQVPMAGPEPALAERWLKEQGVVEPSVPLAEAGYAPLSALTITDPQHRALRSALLRALCDPARLDVPGLADKLQGTDPPVVVGWLQRWCYDLLRLRSRGRPRFNPDFSSELEKLARTADERGLLALGRAFTDAQRIAQHPLNPRLFLESLLLYYSRAIMPQEEATRG